MRSRIIFVFVCAYVIHSLVIAEDSTVIATTPETSTSIQATQLNELAVLIERKAEQRNALKTLLDSADNGTLPSETQKLNGLNSDLTRLQETFQLITLGDTEIGVLNTPESSETSWQEDVLDILKPLMDSLKSLTKKPRQVATLREAIEVIDQKNAAIEQALQATSDVNSVLLAEKAQGHIERMEEQWRDQQQQLHQERLIALAHLENLTDGEHSVLAGIWPTTRDFLLGRGLTLLITIMVSILVWLLMRLVWWLYTKHFTSKDIRRNSTWFRVVAYSYYLVTIIMIVFSAVVVLYFREDLLLLALAILLIAGAVLSFRHFLPRYVSEARLLLNLGSVREDERVVYNGLPWQVMSLNLYSVLRNPALDGVIRLPLETIATLVSRPVRNRLWFPTNTDDYVILPNEMLGQIKHQTPDLVEINVRGGMSMTYTTPDFYQLNIINLSREESFGVSITFGLDYALQKISLTDIPTELHKAISAALEETGYSKHLVNMIVELSAANSSSLDFLIFATLKSEVAGDYYKIQRLLTQTCVAVSNDHNWTIPFPQLTVHQSS